MKQQGLLLIACAALVLSAVLILNGCPGSNVYKSDTELFKKFLFDPIPESVSGLRVNRPRSSSDPVHVMNFKINRIDIQAILKANPFTEYSNWTWSTRHGTVRWTFPYKIRDPVDETIIIEQGKKTELIPLDRDENGRIQPEWFRPDMWDEVRFYAYVVSTNLNNANHLACHVLIYNEELSEAYYLRGQTGGL